MSGLIRHKKNWAKHDHEGCEMCTRNTPVIRRVFMMIFTVVMAWLVMIEHIIATLLQN